MSNHPDDYKMMSPRINLGCGNNYKKGWINIDIDKSIKAEKHFDFNKTPWPINSNTIKLVECKQVLEHLNIPFDKFIEENYRILQRDGMLVIEVPNPFFWRWRIEFLLGRYDGSYWSPHHTKLIHPNHLLFELQLKGFKTTVIKKGLYFLPISLSEKNLVIQAIKRN